MMLYVYESGHLGRFHSLLPGELAWGSFAAERNLGAGTYLGCWCLCGE